MKYVLPLVAAMLLPSLSQAEVMVMDPHVRATLPGQQNSAGFMMLHNKTAEPVTLNAVTSSVAASTELHNHVNVDGVMKMRQVTGIEVPANGMTELKPGSYHVMFLGLNQPIAEGDNVDITLSFSDGSSKQVTLPARKVTAKSSHKHKHH